MKILKYILLFLSICQYASTMAQHTIIGKVADENNIMLEGATVVAIDAVDSTMVSFALTDDKGRFRLNNIPDDSLIVQISYISFATHNQNVLPFGKSKDIDLGTITLYESSEVLQEITVKAEHIPMGIRGDTISYNADAFKTRPNASVEELLKQLPGIEVERDGNIKAQGEDVENVLVDGKEFFGGDPTMATKNLQAEAVDKVEVYDKKSEVAEFTGIDDGEEKKTINLKLKEDHKQGAFGNADLAGGTEDSYQGKLNYFRFSPKMQASVIAARNNINEETFTFQDQIEFMGGISAAMSSGGINFVDYQGLEDGLNTSSSVGTNFNYDISEKLSLRSFYLYNGIENMLDQQSFSQNITESFRYDNSDTLISNKNNRKHQLNTKFNYKLNALTELVFQNNVNFRNGDIARMETSQYSTNGEDAGNTLSDFDSDQGSWGWDSKTWLKRKFAKKGRSFIGTFTFKKDVSDKNETINNINRVQNSMMDVYQNQLYDNALEQISFDLSITEPLSSKYFLGFQYAYGISKENPIRLFYDIENSEQKLNESLSTEYDKTYIYQRPGINIRRNVKKLKMNLAARLQLTELNGVINTNENEINGQYTNFLPSFSLDYEMKGGKSINFNYNTAVIAPTLDQLMPLPDNTVANFAYIGNPGLVPQYDNRFGLGFHLFDNFNFTSFFVNMNTTISNDRIVYKTNIDDNLFRTVEPVNTDKYRDFSLYASLSRPFRPLKLKYRLRLRARSAEYISFINNIESDVVDNNANISFSLSNRKTDKVLVEAGITADLSERQYGIAPEFNQSFINTRYFLVNRFYFKGGWTLSSDLDYTLFSDDNFNAAPSYTLWGASLSKLLFDDKLEISIRAHDILNQNIGYRRYGDIQSLQEVSFQNLGRFVMIGLNYKIGNAPRQDGMIVEIE